MLDVVEDHFEVLVAEDGSLSSESILNVDAM